MLGRHASPSIGADPLTAPPTERFSLSENRTQAEHIPATSSFFYFPSHRHPPHRHMTDPLRSFVHNDQDSPKPSHVCPVLWWERSIPLIAKPRTIGEDVTSRPSLPKALAFCHSIWTSAFPSFSTVSVLLGGPSFCLLFSGDSEPAISYTVQSWSQHLRKLKSKPFFGGKSNGSSLQETLLLTFEQPYPVLVHTLTASIAPKSLIFPHPYQGADVAPGVCWPQF